MVENTSQKNHCSNIWLLILMTFLIMNTGCSQNVLQTIHRNNKISGKIENSRYLAPENLFSISIPEMCLKGGYIKDSFECDIDKKGEVLTTGSVQFFGKTQMYSSFDDYFFINIIEIPESAMFCISQSNEKREELLRDVLSTVILESLKPLTNQAQVVFTKMVLLPSSELALFAEIDLPGLQNKLSDDSIIASAGILITTINNSIITFSTLRPFSYDVPIENKSEILNDKVLSFYRTFLWEKQ